MNYSETGFKSGVEIHQQLDTEKKLFCSCKSQLTKIKSSGSISRKLRAVAGETGDIDVAALHESVKEKSFEYNIYPDESCLIELDEEPPHPVNQEALKIALQVAVLLNCEIPDEIHVMRKTVVDGSNTSGFQRTAIVGVNGWIDTSKGKVGITNVSLEEDSSQILERTETKVVYGLDRLGIPLVEIGTAPDSKDPEHTREIAEKIGLILRSTGKVKKGLGTIRQDVNVSIKGGARAELKGFQELSTIPLVIENEIKRQQDLLKKGKKPEKEVRKVEPDNSTSFLRPMPGAARLYPETDLPPIPVDQRLLEEIKANPPEFWEEKLKRLSKFYNLNEQLAENLLKSGKADLFETVVKLGFEINLVYRTLTATVKEVEREVSNSKLNDNLVLEIFKNSPKNISKEALSEALKAGAASGKVEKIESGLSEQELRKIVKEVISKNKDALQKHNPVGILMGEVMKQARGKADGKLVAKILGEEIKNV